LAVLIGVIATVAHAQPVRSQATSTVSLAGSGSEKTLEIHNVTFHATEKLLLRQTVTSKHILGDKGQESNLAVEAWKLGIDPKQKPLYTIAVEGTGGRTVDGVFYVAERGLEEVEWWSVYGLQNGEHLFDTHVPLASFESGYYGFEVPEGEQGNLIGTVVYATGQHVKRRVALTCDDPKQAALLRSYWDTTRTLSVRDEKPARALKLVFQPGSVTVAIPIAAGDLDIAHAQMPKNLHLKAK
jgi:hypothetical protein